MWQAQEGRDHICLAHPVSSESVAVSSDAWLLPTEIRDLNNCFVFGSFLDYKEQQQQKKDSGYLVQKKRRKKRGGRDRKRKKKSCFLLWILRHSSGFPVEAGICWCLLCCCFIVSSLPLPCCVSSLSDHLPFQNSRTLQSFTLNLLWVELFHRGTHTALVLIGPVDRGQDVMWNWHCPSWIRNHLELLPHFSSFLRRAWWRT